MSNNLITYWLVDLQYDRVSGSLWRTYWLVDWPTTNRLNDLLTGRYAIWESKLYPWTPLKNYTNWLTYWLTDLLTYWLAHLKYDRVSWIFWIQLKNLTNWPSYWLTDLLTGPLKIWPSKLNPLNPKEILKKLTDLLTYWLTANFFGALLGYFGPKNENFDFFLQYLCSPPHKLSNDIWYDYIWRKPIFTHFQSFFGPFWAILGPKMKNLKNLSKFCIHLIISFPTIYDTSIFEENPFLPIFGPFLVHFGPFWAHKWFFFNFITKVVLTSP